MTSRNFGIFWTPSPSRRAFYYKWLSTVVTKSFTHSTLRLWRHLWSTPNTFLWSCSVLSSRIWSYRLDLTQEWRETDLSEKLSPFVFLIEIFVQHDFWRQSFEEEDGRFLCLSLIWRIWKKIRVTMTISHDRSIAKLLMFEIAISMRFCFQSDISSLNLIITLIF